MSSPPSHVARRALPLQTNQPASLAMSSGRQRWAKRSRVAVIHSRATGARTRRIVDDWDTRYAMSVVGFVSVAITGFLIDQFPFRHRRNTARRRTGVRSRAPPRIASNDHLTDASARHAFHPTHPHELRGAEVPAASSTPVAAVASLPVFATEAAASAPW